MLCRNCGYEWDPNEKEAETFVSIVHCPNCAVQIHRMPEIDHQAFLYDEEKNEDDEEELQRMRRQRRLLQFLIWLIVISFIIWFMLRLFSGLSQIGMPEFNEAEYF